MKKHYNTQTKQQKVQCYKNGWEKKEERKLFQNIISANTKEEGKKQHLKKDPILYTCTSTRTSIHFRHVTNLPRRYVNSSPTERK